MFTKESNLNKAREHPLLLSKRPPYVTILTLVRDAAARLPNGEGTRAEVRLNFVTLSRFIIPQLNRFARKLIVVSDFVDIYISLVILSHSLHHKYDCSNSLPISILEVCNIVKYVLLKDRHKIYGDISHKFFKEYMK